MIVHINQDTRSGFIFERPDVLPFTEAWFAWLQSEANNAFDIYDDNPIDDDKLCSMHKEGDTWYVVYQGHKRAYRAVIGTSRDVTPIRTCGLPCAGFGIRPIKMKAACGGSSKTEVSIAVEILRPVDRFRMASVKVAAQPAIPADAATRRQDQGHFARQNELQ